MGDRVSISFKHDGEESVALFSHWGGIDFVEQAREYVRELVKERGAKQGMPLDRLEPGTVLVDFIRYLTAGERRVESSLYLGATPGDGDNSDNGHHVIALAKNDITDRPAIVTDEQLEYLDDLRESGETNMYGACPYLVEAFGLTKADASVILSYWMKSFGERHLR